MPSTAFKSCRNGGRGGGGKWNFGGGPGPSHASSPHSPRKSLSNIFHMKVLVGQWLFCGNYGCSITFRSKEHEHRQTHDITFRCEVKSNKLMCVYVEYFSKLNAPQQPKKIETNLYGFVAWSLHFNLFVLVEPVDSETNWNRFVAWYLI